MPQKTLSETLSEGINALKVLLKVQEWENRRQQSTLEESQIESFRHLAGQCGSGDPQERMAGWKARLVLHEHNKADEPVHVFREAYIAAVLEEKSPLVLEALKHLNTTALDFREVAVKAWEKRLEDPDPDVIAVARKAVFRLFIQGGTPAGRGGSPDVIQACRKALDALHGSPGVSGDRTPELTQALRQTWRQVFSSQEAPHAYGDRTPELTQAWRQVFSLSEDPHAYGDRTSEWARIWRRVAAGRERVQWQRGSGSSPQDREVTGPGR